MDLEEKRRKAREYAAEWRRKNPEKHRAINKKSREKNLEVNRKRDRERYHATKHTRTPLTEAQKKRKSEINRIHRLRSEYGITPEEYQALSESQGHVCAICGNPDLKYDNLAVDHCHDTGRVRGLLCRLCNTGLGALGDKPEGLKKALAYLEKHYAE